MKGDFGRGCVVPATRSVALLLALVGSSMTSASTDHGAWSKQAQAGTAQREYFVSRRGAGLPVPTLSQGLRRGEQLLLLSAHQGDALRIGEFGARDAADRALPPSLERQGNEVRLKIGDGSAAHPTGIGSLLGGTYDGLLQSDQPNAQLGVSVAGAGDVNGDGIDEVIVGAPFYDDGETDEGAAFLRFGGAGLPDVQLESNQPAAFLGQSVAGAGDVNGDGFDDVVVGAPYYDNGQSDEGVAFLYFGGPGGVDTTADALLEVNQAGALFGYRVAGAGDVNGDGFDDVVVGAFLYDNGQIDEGAAFIYFGGAGAFDTIPDAQLESNQNSGDLGLAVAGAGDVNGDGFDDVIIGAPSLDNGQADEGVALLYLGGAGGFDTTSDALLEVDQANAEFGLSVAGAGDVNGDGFNDVFVGAWLYDNGQSDEGAVFVYFGGVGAFDTTADALLESNRIGAHLGYSVAVAGDVNGDGFDDVIAGARGYGNGQSGEGAALVYFGGGGVFDAIADTTLESDQVGAQAGTSVAGAGDPSGDGVDDVVVGAPFYDNSESNEGVGLIYFGVAAGTDGIFADGFE